MNIVYMNEHAKAYLTTDSPSSHYGIPSLRIDGEIIDWGEFAHDLGPADVLPSGHTAAALCCLTYHLQDEETQAASRMFCGQWPEGPQPGEEKSP